MGVRHSQSYKEWTAKIIGIWVSNLAKGLGVLQLPSFIADPKQNPGGDPGKEVPRRSDNLKQPTLTQIVFFFQVKSSLD